MPPGGDRGAEDLDVTDVHFQSSFREALIDVVDNCLRHKPEALPTDQYFAEHLEPILSALAVDCLASQPENPAAFLQQWAKKHEVSESHKDPEGEDVSPIARMAITTWYHKERGRELERLQRQSGLLKQVLGPSERGRRLLQALEDEDLPALSTLLEPPGSTDLCDAPAAESMEHLGKILRSLRNRGVTSASSAFLRFSPDQDWTIPVQRMHVEMSHLQVLREDELRQLLRSLDPSGSGRISYNDFRTLVVRFLATSRDFHCALSPEEFNAIMFRIEARLAANGATVGQALVELDAGKTGALPDSEFMHSLRRLRLGLSNKEVAQVFNSLSANSFRAGGAADLPNPLMRGQVSIALFEALVEKCSQSSQLKEKALTSFSRIRDALVRTAKTSASSWITCLRQYADPPVRQFLNFGSFSSLLMDMDSSITSPETGRLWCILEKDDLADEPLVRIEELLRWMRPQGS